MMIKVVRAIGHELVQVASTELTIGNYLFINSLMCVIVIVSSMCYRKQCSPGTALDKRGTC